MKQIGSLLWDNVRPVQIFGSNTGVGKTVVSTVLLRSATLSRGKPFYIKPVSTGSDLDDDSKSGANHCSHIKKYVPSVNGKTLLKYKIPVSPHLAARGSPAPKSDISLLTLLHDELVSVAESGDHICPIVECAGGVLSPAPSGNLQADVYRPLRLPVILVGDHRLGGIATTISAFESLHLRGYDVLGLVMFQDRIFENSSYLYHYFHDREIPTGTLLQPPPPSTDKALDEFCMRRYYEDMDASKPFIAFTQTIVCKLQQRTKRLKSLPDRTVSSIWHPFLQHTERSPSTLTVIDSAYGDNFQTLHQHGAPATGSLLAPAFDGSASWWTQGLGHGNPDLALTAAHAAGRYGHVMFANAAHEPAVTLAELLLEHATDPESPHKASKVFYTDNGSTGMEVAVKMALKSAAKRYGWQPSDDVMVLGLKGSYHGDTIGVMDCSEGNVYNAKVEWYKGRGYWFDFPTVKMSQGKWLVVPPKGMDDIFEGTQEFDSLNNVFDIKNRQKTGNIYQKVIDQVLQHLVAQGSKFGALVMEPVILGAGGMLFADPLFQYELWQATQRLDQGPIKHKDTKIPEGKDWTGMPLITDEVFTGMYRLGVRRSSDLISVHADVSVYAKLLTGGLLPLAATVASKGIYNAFLSKDKADALLHGHSYTAHAMGCSVACSSIRKYVAMDDTDVSAPISRLDKTGAWNGFKQDWNRTEGSETVSLDGEKNGDAKQDGLWSMWPNKFTTKLSFREDVEGVFALGSVLVVEMKDPKGAGYTSTASLGVRDRLMEVTASLNQSVHCRVLGNILYFMASLTSHRKTLYGVQKQIEAALDARK
ncbi:hypothetical protein ANO11243_012830 [Dothideomycetidae sp. 11243]|nr:hypothetical protein ANO11243_012830 [fungal sp. No.11243]